MTIQETEIEGLLIFNCLSFPDNRGELLKPFSESFFEDYKYPINLSFKETWFTKSKKDVIRGMHMQLGPKACEKLVSVVEGSVLDVIIDLRERSATFKRIFNVVLDSKQPRALYIPIGCAHGYKVLENNTITLYMATETHDVQNDVGILWNTFGFDWNIQNPILSEKDLQLPVLNF